MKKNISKCLEIIDNYDYNKEHLEKILKCYSGVHLMMHLDRYLSELVIAEDEVVDKLFYDKYEKWKPHYQKEWDMVDYEAKKAGWRV